MEDYGVECENCQCITCVKNDDTICLNCDNCSGNNGYSKWKMDCEKYKECNDPNQVIKEILNGII